MRVVMGLRWVACVWALSMGCSDDDGDDATTPKDAGNTTVPDSGPPPAMGTATWTMMGGDARNHYNNPTEKTLSVENVKGLKEKWRFQIAGFPPGSPLIVDGKVFVMATGGSYAIDLQTGAELWKRSDVTGTASLAYADGFIYAHESDAGLSKLDANTGASVWGPIRSYELAGCDGTSSPVVAGGKVLVGHSCGVAEVTNSPSKAIARGGVEAFKIEDGTRAWTYYTAAETGENGAMVWSTVGVDVEAKVVFATTGNNYTLVGENSDSIHAIDLETGVQKWKQQVRKNDVWSIGDPTFVNPTGQSLDTDFGANPILIDVDGRKLVAAGDKASTFWALDRETGQVVWMRDKLSDTHNPANGGVLMNGAFDGKYIYAASNEPPMQSVLRVLKPLTGEDAVPPVKLGATVWGAPSLANGLLFVPVNSVLKVFDARDLSELVSFDTGGTIAAGAATIVDGTVVVQSGLMYAFARDALPNNQIIAYSLDGSGTGNPMDSGTMSGAPTFTAIYDEIIVASGCNGAALCHGGDVGALPMKSKAETHALLVGVKAGGMNLSGTGTNCKDVDILRVAPNKPDDSLLIKKLEGTQTCGDPMPPGQPLDPAKIKQVRDWITAGANND